MSEALLYRHKNTLCQLIIKYAGTKKDKHTYIHKYNKKVYEN